MPRYLSHQPRAGRRARLGEPDDVSMAIAALLSEEGRWITAQNIEVSGGLNL